MGSIFDFDATYRKSCASKYTRKYLVEIQHLATQAEYNEAKTCCAELCPLTLGEKTPPEDNALFQISPAEKSELSQLLNSNVTEVCADEREETNSDDSIERFKYLQFLYYIIEKNRKCTAKKTPYGRITPTGKVSTKRTGRSLLNSIFPPSQRYISMYSKMISEIRGKVSEEVLAATDGAYSTKSRTMQSDKGWYDDSIHGLQQSADLIAQTLSCAYNHGEQALEILERREYLFYSEMTQLEKEGYPKVPLKSCWDELYLRLNYARCTYWEHDLLLAYKEVQKISLIPLPEGHKFAPMRQEANRESISENDCILYFDEKAGKIIESREVIADISYDIEPYIEALRTYVKTHVHEIAEKTFRIQNITRLEEKRIINRLNYVCNFLRIELLRYGRNSTLTKTKLISIFQVIFLALPGSGISPLKRETVMAQSPGGLQREKNTLSSSFSNYEEKEPYYLQVICAWMNYQALWNAYGSCFAQKYLETNIQALNTILAIGYQSGMAGLQRNTEWVLFAIMKSLISDEDGKEILNFCIEALKLQGFVIEVDRPISAPLLTFGKFCKLFSFSEIVNLIVRELKAWGSSKSFGFIDLRQATDGAFRIHSLRLGIFHNRKANVYYLHGLTCVDFHAFYIFNNI